MRQDINKTTISPVRYPCAISGTGLSLSRDTGPSNREFYNESYK
jgi:hypothetical protein